MLKNNCHFVGLLCKVYRLQQGRLARVVLAGNQVDALQLREAPGPRSTESF